MYSTTDGEPKQLLVDAVDGLASIKPHAPYAYYPRSPTGYSDGFAKVTYRQFANAVNGLAWWMTALLGKSTSFQTVMYVGANDVLQNAMILACAKTGYKLLLASPRNQLPALKSLLDVAECHVCLAADPKAPFARLAQEARPMNIFQTPLLDTLLKQRFPHYSFDKTFEEAKNDPLVTLHTSGTTSLPKPITYTNEWVSTYMQALRVKHSSQDAGWDLKDYCLRGVRLLVMFPPFHAANIFCTSFLAAACATTIILPPAHLPPTADVFVGCIKNIQVDTAFIPPHLISQLAANKDHLTALSSHLETIISGGGKISEAHGDAVSAHTNLMTVYGATETGSVPELVLTRPGGSQYWNYIGPHQCAGWEFRPHVDPSLDNSSDSASDSGSVSSGSTSPSQENVFEAWIVRKDSSTAHQPVFALQAHLKANEFCTRDLFVPHPHIPGLWKWHGRMDDTIALGTGANVSPVIMENGLHQLPEVQAALMIGNGQQRPSLLLDLKSGEDDYEAVLERVWKTVEELNVNYFADHRVLKQHMLVAVSEKPVVRSLKGSVQRSATVSLYGDEIRGMYAAAVAA